MKKRKMTKIEFQYRRFNILSNMILYAVLGSMVISGVLFVLAKSDECKALFGLFMSLGTATIIFTAPQIAKKRTSYLQQLSDERNKITRTGLFEEVYEAYRHDGFEFNLIYDKRLFCEYHGNAIDIGVRKNNHEFLIAIDEKSISIVVDEETDHPLEIEIPLSDIATIEHLYLTINECINKHSSR